MSTKAVLFDLDNTLTHRNHSIERFAEYFSSEFNSKLQEVSKSDIYSVIVSVDHGGYLSSDSKYSTIKDTVSSALLDRLLWIAKPTFSDLRDFWIEYMPKSSVPMFGVPEILIKLKNQSFRIGVVSNGAQNSREAVIKALQIERFLDTLVSSGKVGYKKPESEIFTIALNRLGVDKSRAWFVGDHPVNDVFGAQAAGLNSVWLSGFHDWPDNYDDPNYRIESLSELIDLVN